MGSSWLPQFSTVTQQTSSGVVAVGTGVSFAGQPRTLVVPTNQSIKPYAIGTGTAAGPAVTSTTPTVASVVGTAAVGLLVVIGLVIAIRIGKRKAAA